MEEKMKVSQTKIQGCYLINPEVHHDLRGKLVKTFNKDSFTAGNLKIDWKEQFYTVSGKSVLRGLHFQKPPHQLSKLVYCIRGKIIDVIVDLRIGSPTYARYEQFELSSDNNTMLYLDEGIAHGFYSMTDDTITVYNTTECYSKEHDCGILWNSLNIPWPDKNPVISDKDKNLIPFKDFISPFKFNMEQS
jgi:dTDP-4-dehydrorhamnose 3,5-epimerase